jgi:hypothetical protein
MCKTLFAFGIDAVRASPDFKPGLARIGYILFGVFPQSRRFDNFFHIPVVVSHHLL